MFSLGAGLWLVHGGWLTEWLSGTPRSPERWNACYYALVADSGDCFNLAVVESAIRPSATFYPRFVCFSRLPPGVAYLFAGPLLVVEQLKRQLAIIHEAQRARGVPLDEGWYQRLRAMPALIIPLTHNALNDLAIRGAALDMRAFRIHNRRTTLWAPADSPLQRVARYTMILLMLTEFGAWIWLR